MTCEELVFKAGEGTPHCLRAYNLMGRTYAAKQAWDEASAFFSAVIDGYGTQGHKFEGVRLLKPRRRQRFPRHVSTGKVRDLLAQ